MNIDIAALPFNERNEAYIETESGLAYRITLVSEVGYELVPLHYYKGVYKVMDGCEEYFPTEQFFQDRINGFNVKGILYRAYFHFQREYYQDLKNLFDKK